MDLHKKVLERFYKEEQPGEKPKYAMVNSMVVPVSQEALAKGFDKVEEEGATCSLANISKKEAQRRHKMADRARLLTIGMAAAFVAFREQVPWYYRFAIHLPLGVW